MAAPKTRYVLIDTCIIQHAENVEIAQGIYRDLSEAYAAGFLPAISQYTVFELLDGAHAKKERDRMQAIAGIRQFRFQERVIRLAARLNYFYREHNLEIRPGDRIIAATCILLPGSILYTTNAKDFPQPFFSVQAKRMNEYKKKQHDAAIYTYFLVPDYSAVMAAYRNWSSR